MKNPVFRRFIKRKVSVIGLVILGLFFFMAIFGPLFFPEGPLEQNLREIGQGPSLEHPCGTDYLGRDILTRIVYGARISMYISFSGVLSGCLIGLLAFPGLLLAIVIVAILGNGTGNTIVAIAVFSIPSIARMVRGVVLTNKDAQYIGAAKVIGESSFKIICKHIVPNSVSQMIVNVTLNLGTAILTSSSLSFLGLGVQPPNPEWGAMLNKAKDVLRSNPWEAIFPGIAITLVVMSFSLVGDGLRDALDPKLKNTR